MKIKTADLAGAALDWAVAKCEGVNEEAFRLFYEPTEPADYDRHGFPEFHYSTIWHKAGPIIEREEIRLTPPLAGETDWLAACGNPDVAGPTPLIAAMRCYVASKLGAEFEVPDEVI